MVFTDRVSRIPIGKLTPNSHFDEELVAATVKKNENCNFKPPDLNSHFVNSNNLIGHNLEVSNDAISRNKLIKIYYKLLAPP